MLLSNTLLIVCVTFGSALKSSSDHSYENTIISEDYPHCGVDLKSLGVDASRIIGRNISQAPAWPWMAALYMIENEDRPSEQRLICKGSVIHRHFVLTAGDCMQDYNYRKRESNKILVKLGWTDLNDLTHLQGLQVREIHIHPEFQIHRYYGYDIALLELEKPIDFNLSVTPVCLPPKEIPVNSRFYRNESLDRTIELNRVSRHIPVKVTLTQILKDINLAVQPTDIYIESLREDKFEDDFTDRRIYSAEGKYFASDDGGPAMQPQLTEEGHLSWTQVGVVHWGIDCDREESFVFFSYLRK